MLARATTAMAGRVIVCAMIGALGLARASEPSSSAPNPFTIVGHIFFSAGEASDFASLGNVPGGKYMVVQTVSLERPGAAAGNGLLFVQTTIRGKTGTYALPPAVSDGSLPSGATLSSIFYAGGATQVLGTAYRSGDLSQAETDTVTVTGYLVDGAPTG